MKNHILNFIEKYSLGGVLESVKWTFNEETNSLSVAVSTNDRNGDVEVLLKNNLNLPSIEVGIRETSLLKKMMNVLENNVVITPTFRGDKVLKLTFSDGNTEVSYAATDLSVIKEYVPVNINCELILSIPLTKEFIEKFNKAKNAMSSEEIFKIIRQNEKLNISLGYSDRNTNRINISVMSSIGYEKFPENLPISFNAEYLKQIINNTYNANSETSGSLPTLNVYCDDDKYVVQIIFEDDQFKCKYVLYQRRDDEI